MTNGRIARGLLGCCLGCCSGCAVFRPPQVFPDEWKIIDAADRMDAAGLRAMLHRPRDLDESLERTHKLVRQYARAGAQADHVPQVTGTALAGLGAFGGYRAVVHPSARTAAAILGTGAAIYSAGSGIEWGERSAAYIGAAQGFNCLIGAARPYVINHHDGRQTGQQRLRAAQGPLREALTKLELALAAHAALDEEYKIADARIIPSGCPATNSSRPVCAPVSGVDSTRYERDCTNFEEHYRRVCSTGRKPAVYSAPAPEVGAAFALARAARTQARVALDESGRIQAGADDAAQQLWTDSIDVVLRAFAAVRRTGFDLTKLFQQLGAALQAAQAAEVSGRRQAGTAPSDDAKQHSTRPAEPPPDADRQRMSRQVDAGTREALRALKDAIGRVDTTLLPVQEILGNNPDKPAFDPAQFKACISDEAVAAQTALRMATAPPPEVPVTATPQLLAKLKLGADASDAAVESRIRSCQGFWGMPQRGKLTRPVADLLLAGRCDELP